MTILYNILRNFLVYFVPIVIIIFSISLNLPNANLHKQTFKNTDFYNKLSREIKKLKENEKINTNDPKTLAQNSAFSLFSSSISELTTPNWLENVIAKNIDLTSNWLLEKQDEWTFYFPSGQIQTSLNQNLDKQTKELVNTNKSDIPECTNENLEKLKTGNFDLAKNFCLPKEVKNGTNNLSDFLPKVDINSLTNGLDLSANIDNFKAQNLGIASSKSYEFFVGMRQYLTKIRTGSPYVLAGFAVILLIITILSKAIGHSIRKDLISNLWKISLSTLSLSIVFVLVLGGLFMLNSWATNWILPGVSVPGLSDLLTWQWIWFLFDLVSIAIWSGLGMVILNLILLILPKGSTKKLNQHLQEKPQKKYQNSDFSSNNPNQNGTNLTNSRKNTLNDNQNNDFNNSSNSNDFSNDYSNSYPEKTHNQSQNLQNLPENESQNIGQNPEQNVEQNNQNNFQNYYQNTQKRDNSNSFQPNQSFSNFDQEFQQEIEYNSKSVSTSIPTITPQISDIIRREKGENSYQTPTQIPRTRSIPPQYRQRTGQTILPKNEISNTNLDANSNTFTNENLPTNYPKSQNPQALEQIYNPKTNSDNFEIERQEIEKNNWQNSKSIQPEKSQNQSQAEQNLYLKSSIEYKKEIQQNVQENPYSDKFYNQNKQNLQNSNSNRNDFSNNDDNNFVLVDEDGINNDYNFEIKESNS